MHLPLLVYAGIRGDEAPARPLAVATTLLYLGIDLIDDLADGDLVDGALPPHWDGYRATEINLAAATLLSSLPQLALAELDVPPDRGVALQRVLARGLLRMSAGQQRDLALAGTSGADVGEVEASVVAKSGEGWALFAALAAQLAGAEPEVVDAYASFGRWLGAARQIANDCHDLFTAAHSRDLASGARTLPIAMHLERLAGQERHSFLGLLDGARRDSGAQRAVRARLRAAGELLRCGVQVEVHCRRAGRALERARPLEPAAGLLRSMIDEASFLPKRALERDP